jgi:hypothetical protein
MPDFLTLSDAGAMMTGKSVAVVGSGPSCLENMPGTIDGHDIVLRVNNHKVGDEQGRRTDVHYSFYGASIRKTAAELQGEGVKLCMCKCPNAKALNSDWHERHGRQNGVDFRYVYTARAKWWFCPTAVPSVDEFLAKVRLLQGHIPSTGFSAILDVLAARPASVYITGFDFFSSGVHNVDEKWRPGPADDPIRHRPDLEIAWLVANMSKHAIVTDMRLKFMLRKLR